MKQTKTTLCCTFWQCATQASISGVHSVYAVKKAEVERLNIFIMLPETEKLNNWFLNRKMHSGFDQSTLIGYGRTS